MRLGCPNCGAQYEVEDRMIPRAGRDVQCSNCGHGWFQERPPQDPPEAETRAPDSAAQARTAARERAVSARDRARTESPAEQPAPSAPDPDHDPAPPQTAPDAAPAQDDDLSAVMRALESAGLRDTSERAPPPPASAPEPVDTAPGDTGDDDENEDDDDDARRPAPPAPARTRPADDVLEILRAEAERERKVRRAEAQAGLHEQPELDMGPPPRRAPVRPDPHTPPLTPRARNPLENAGEDDRLAAAGALSGRAMRGRALLPDIEDINATLSPSRMAGGGTADKAPPQVRSLPQHRPRGANARVSFAAVLVAATFAVMIYTQAETLSRSVPEMAGPLDSYVDWVNGQRVWLDRTARNLVENLLDG